MRKILLISVGFLLTTNYLMAQGPVTVQEQTVSWSEIVEYDYFLENSNEMSNVLDLDKVTLASREITKDYKYIWSSSAFEHFEVRDHTPLQNGDYFSYPVHWAKYTHGQVEHKADNGATLNTFNIEPDMTLSEWQQMNPDKVLPIMQKANLNSFVPVISASRESQMISEGYQITRRAGGLAVSKGIGYSIDFDNTAKRITEKYLDADSNQIMELTYFREDNDLFIKIREERISKMSFTNGICYQEIKTTHFTNIVENKGGLITPRQAENSNLADMERVKIYPNPSENIFYIRSSIGSGEYAPIIKSVTNISGQNVPFSTKVYDSKTIILELTLTISGTYLVNYSVNGEIFTDKLIYNNH